MWDQPIVSGAGQVGLLLTDGGMPGLYSAPEWFWGIVSESSVAIAPLALVVQGNHEHRDVIVGHLPFSCGTVVLSLCAVYQHLGQLREPVGIILRMHFGARAERQGHPSGRTCIRLDMWGPKQCSPAVGPGKATSMGWPQTGPWRFWSWGFLNPEILGTHHHPPEV